MDIVENTEVPAVQAEEAFVANTDGAAAVVANMDAETASFQPAMDDVSDIPLTPEQIQRKLYFIVDKLKEMHSNLPEAYQNRISYELLTELAHALLNDTIYEIVKQLMEIQHVTEEHLFQMREVIEGDYKQEVQDWTVKISDPEELEHILDLMKLKHRKKLQETDKNIQCLLDKKVQDQQSTLHSAGVPGFYITNNPREITLQMYLLDFILRLSRIKFEPHK